MRVAKDAKTRRRHQAGIPYDCHIRRGYSRSFLIIKNGLQVQKLTRPNFRLQRKGKPNHLMSLLRKKHVHQRSKIVGPKIRQNALRRNKCTNTMREFPMTSIFGRGFPVVFPSKKLDFKSENKHDNTTDHEEKESTIIS